METERLAAGLAEDAVDPETSVFDILQEWNSLNDPSFRCNVCSVLETVPAALCCVQSFRSFFDPANLDVNEVPDFFVLVMAFRVPRALEDLEDMAKPKNSDSLRCLRAFVAVLKETVRSFDDYAGAVRSVVGKENESLRRFRLIVKKHRFVRSIADLRRVLFSVFGDSKFVCCDKTAIKCVRLDFFAPCRAEACEVCGTFHSPVPVLYSVTCSHNICLPCPVGGRGFAAAANFNDRDPLAMDGQNFFNCVCPSCGTYVQSMVVAKNGDLYFCNDDPVTGKFSAKRIVVSC